MVFRVEGRELYVLNIDFDAKETDVRNLLSEVNDSLTKLLTSVWTAAES
jgi:hypothetical protein